MKRLLIAIAATSLLPGIAGAQSVLTQNVVFGPSATDFSSTAGTVTTNAGALPFFFFDSRVGTLNSITFAASYQLLSSVTLNNTSATAASGSVYVQSAARYLADDSGVTQALNRAVNTLVDPVDGTSVQLGGRTLSPIAFDLRESPTTYSLAPLGSTLVTGSANGTFTFVDTNAADLAAFTRTGTFSYNALLSSLTGTVLSSSGGNVTAQDMPLLSGSLTISYNITPLGGTVPGGGSGGAPTAAVPEPGAWLTMMAGIGLAGALARRRRSARRRPRLAPAR